MNIMPAAKYPARTPEEMKNRWVVREETLAKADADGIRIHRLIGEYGGAPELAGIVDEPHKFGFERVEALPGQGIASLQHDYVVVLFSFNSQWRVFWGNEAGVVDGEIELDRWDLFSVPAGIWFGFENIGDSHGTLLVAKEDH